jgi:hypothetical protein
LHTALPQTCVDPPGLLRKPHLWQLDGHFVQVFLQKAAIYSELSGQLGFEQLFPRLFAFAFATSELEDPISLAPSCDVVVVDEEEAEDAEVCEV